MREIKFRAWHKIEKLMFQVGGFANLDYPRNDRFNYVTIGSGLSRPADATPHIEDIELMQYTGLKDKNGVEIYEGDICNVTKTSVIDNRHVAEVKWQTNIARIAFVIDYHNDDGKLFYGYEELNHESIEVIGNIYENKELLK